MPTYLYKVSLCKWLLYRLSFYVNVSYEIEFWIVTFKEGREKQKTITFESISYTSGTQQDISFNHSPTEYYSPILQVRTLRSEGPSLFISAHTSSTL